MQTFRLSYTFLIIVVIIPLVGCGGAVLSGTVRNSNTGHPIQNVAIEVRATVANTPLPAVSTDESGSFRIEKLAKQETYQLTFRKKTIATSQEEYRLKGMDKKKLQNLDIRLNEFSVVEGRAWGELFGIEPRHETQLNAGNVSADLRQELTNGGISLSQSAAVEKRDNGWLIRDKGKGRIYLAKKAEGKLTIYEPISGAVIELLEKKAGNWVRVRNIEEKTKPDGSFIISGIAKPGRYRLGVYHVSYRAIRYPTDTAGHSLKVGEIWRTQDGQIALESSGVSEDEGKLIGG